MRTQKHISRPLPFTDRQMVGGIFAKLYLFSFLGLLFHQMRTHHDSSHSIDTERRHFRVESSTEIRLL